MNDNGSTPLEKLSNFRMPKLLPAQNKFHFVLKGLMGVSLVTWRIARYQSESDLQFQKLATAGQQKKNDFWLGAAVDSVAAVALFHSPQKWQMHYSIDLISLHNVSNSGPRGLWKYDLKSPGQGGPTELGKVNTADFRYT